MGVVNSWTRLTGMGKCTVSSILVTMVTMWKSAVDDGSFSKFGPKKLQKLSKLSNFVTITRFTTRNASSTNMPSIGWVLNIRRTGCWIWQLWGNKLFCMAETIDFCFGEETPLRSIVHPKTLKYRHRFGIPRAPISHHAFYSIIIHVIQSYTL